MNAPTNWLIAQFTRQAFMASKIFNLFRHGTFDRSTADGRAKNRHRRIAQTALSFAIMRGLGMLLPIVTISYTLNYLGAEVYGLWITVTSFFAFFAFADLGLGNGFVTLFSQAWGREDMLECRRLTSTVFFLFLGVAAVLLLLFILAFPLTPWASVLGAKSAVAIHYSPILVVVVVIPQLIQIPFFMVQRTQLAMQEGFTSNYWQIVGGIVNVVAVITLVKLDARPSVLVATSASIPSAVTILNWYWFFYSRNRLLTPTFQQVDRSFARLLLTSGSGFFLLSILQTFGLMIDNLIVAHCCGLGEVPAFSIASRVAAAMGMAVGMISLPMWSANGEALARGDVHWVRTTTIRIAKLSLGFALVSGIGLVAFGPSVFHAWLKGSVDIPRTLLAGFALRELGFAIASPFFMVLNGAGRVSTQVIMFLVFTPLVTALKFALAGPFGGTGVIWAMGVVYLVVVVPWVMTRAYRVFTGLEYTIPVA